MAHKRRKLGNRGEHLAASYLEGRGLVVLEEQYKTPYGEIDLVCQEDETIVFVEVKARRSHRFGYPEASVTRKKIQTIARAAEVYLSTLQRDVPWRVDVVAITVREQGEPEIVHFPAVGLNA